MSELATLIECLRQPEPDSPLERFAGFLSRHPSAVVFADAKTCEWLTSDPRWTWRVQVIPTMEPGVLMVTDASELFRLRVR